MEGVFKFAVVMLVAVGMPLTLGLVIAPLAKAFARRIEGRAGVDAAELEALRAEVAELRAVADRLPELEERLDFAERALGAPRTQAAPGLEA